MLQKGVFNSTTTESTCLAGRTSIEKINKIVLSSDDDKRVIMADGIHPLAYGLRNFKQFNKKMSYNEIPNILVHSVT